jgi:predicted transcriptional regulator
MAGQDSALGGDLDQIARIVSSYVRHHQLGPEQLVELIVTVHRALASLGQATPPMPEPRQPAVSIRQSVRLEYVVCLECGFRSRMLRRHLRDVDKIEKSKAILGIITSPPPGIRGMLVKGRLA